MKALKSFKLTKCEKLALLNLCPKTPLEMQLVNKSVFIILNINNNNENLFLDYRRQ